MYGYNEAKDRSCTEVNLLKSPIPPDVKDAIKSKYTAGVTKPQDIMRSLLESGVTEEGSFTMDQLYNYLKNMKKQMGVNNEQDRVDTIKSEDFQRRSEEWLVPKFSRPTAIPPDVKEAIKSLYFAGVTKPQEIMKSLVKDGVMEEGSFPIEKLYNHLKKMKIKMGVKKRLSDPIGGLEM